MKKVALILLISIYSLSTLGIGVQQFFCCGKLKSTTISFIQEVKEQCGNDNTMSGGGCCETKFTSLKVKDSHVPADGISVDLKHFTDQYLIAPSFEIMTLANEPMVVANTSHAPPLHHGIPIYILHCTYRI